MRFPELFVAPHAAGNAGGDRPGAPPPALRGFLPWNHELSEGGARALVADAGARARAEDAAASAPVCAAALGAALLAGLAIGAALGARVAGRRGARGERRGHGDGLL